MNTYEVCARRWVKTQGKHQIRYGGKTVLLAVIDRKAFGVHKRKIKVSKDKKTESFLSKL